MLFDNNKVADAMFSQPAAGTSNIDAAYTYLGQFIAHELIPSTAGRMQSRNVSGRLDLSSLYGCDVSRMAQCHQLLPQMYHSDGSFKLSEDETLPRQGDVLREQRRGLSIALIPEMRNDANLIIAQLHRAFQAVHNKLVVQQWVENASEARRVVTLWLQLVIVEDYLKQLFPGEIYQHYFVQHKPLLNLPASELANYFALASFRFGHSMVRQTYTLNDGFHARVKLTDLMQINSPLKAQHKIDWQRALFSHSKEGLVDNGHKALKIDTHLSFGMANVEAGEVRSSIVEFNLQAAQAARLGSGTDYFAALIWQLKQSDIAYQHLHLTPVSSLAQSSFAEVPGLSITNLPVWLYVLLEAQVQQQGNRLGAMASVINAQVLINSIKQSAVSIYNGDRYNVEQIVSSFPDRLQNVDFVGNQQFTLKNFVNFSNHH